MSIAVIYLDWRGDNRGLVDRFHDSYKRHPAGMPHRLINISDAWETADFGVLPRILPLLDEDYFVFFKTSNYILADDWLLKLYRAVTARGVGIAGASGSWESNASDIWRGVSGGYPSPTRRPTSRPWWRYASAPLRYCYWLWIDGLVPNVHIRPNSFIINRKLFLSLDFRATRSKRALYRFEHGRYSMTAQLMARGYRPVVVGADGSTFNWPFWPFTSGFRSNDCDNLLVGDNRSDEYLAASPQYKRFLQIQAWGGQCSSVEAAIPSSSRPLSTSATLR